MSTPHFSGVPDLMYNWNNSVVFVVPTPNGRLESLASCTQAGQAGWLFSDHEDHLQRLGSANDGRAFIDKCVELGLIVAQVNNLRVPFSSGPRRRGEWAGFYTPEEKDLVLNDGKHPSETPTFEILTSLAKVL